DSDVSECPFGAPNVTIVAAFLGAHSTHLQSTLPHGPELVPGHEVVGKRSGEGAVLQGGLIGRENSR
ncbi:MAG: hypothetical protein ABI142_06035, partial [Bryocella sp.]